MALLEQERHALVGANVHRLVNVPEWDYYADALKEIEQRTLESLATTPPAEVPYQQGLLKGIREVMKLPERLVALGRRPA